MGWKKWELNLPDLSPAEDLAEIIDKIREYLETIVGILETILNFLVAFSDPLAEAIKSLIDAIKEVIEGFLEDVGLYVLHVPVRKRFMTNFLDLGDITPGWAGDLGIFGEGVADTDNPGNEDQIKPPWQDDSLNDFLVNANRYNGGNFGFFKTVVDSLYDNGDINRPQFFDEDDYIGGVVFLVGTNFDPLGFLDDIWKLFGLFDLGVDGVPKAPRPKNLQARAITPIIKSSANSSGGTFSAYLEWDPMEVPITTLADLGGMILYPQRYAILRSKNNVNALSANSIPDLMGSRTLSQGDKFESTEVIYEGPYDMAAVTHLDENIHAEPDDSFYYTVAWKLKGYNKDDNRLDSSAGKEYEYWYTSNVARVVPYPTLPASTPPDWIRTPSVASIFPQFAYFLRLMVAELEKLADKITGGLDLLKEYVDFLKSEINRYEALVNRILDAIEKLQIKFQLPDAGVYYRFFEGKGGNTFLIQDLALSLRESYKSAPPFHEGDEYVTGIVLLTGGPTASSELGEGVSSGKESVKTLITLLGWLFGSGSSKLTPVLENLDTAVNQIEEKYFEEDMSVGSPPPPSELDLAPTLCEEPQPAPQKTFNSDMSIETETSE